MEQDISTPANRRRILMDIKPESASQYHAILQHIFRLEMKFREQDDDENLSEEDLNNDYFENIYWSGFLLYCIGDPTDVEMMCQAKYINFDTRCGFDVETFFGAGFDETVAHMQKIGKHDVADYIQDYRHCTDEHLKKWAEHKRQYYYGAAAR